MFDPIGSTGQLTQAVRRASHGTVPPSHRRTSPLFAPCSLLPALCSLLFALCSLLPAGPPPAHGLAAAVRLALGTESRGTVRVRTGAALTNCIRCSSSPSRSNSADSSDVNWSSFRRSRR